MLRKTHIAPRLVVLACCVVLHTPVVLGVEWASQFDKALDAVTQATRATFEVSLEIRELTSIERSATKTVGLFVSPYALFDQAARRIVVSPNACRARLFSRARSRKEMNDMLFILYVHELLHAYQSSVLDKATAANLGPRILRSLCEGHAVVYSGSIAEAVGITMAVPEYHPATSEIPFSVHAARRRADLLTYFTYTVGAEYVRHSSDTVTDFADLLRQPVTYESMLRSLQPAEVASAYATAGHGFATSAPAAQRTACVGWRAAWVAVNAGTPGGSRQIGELDYLDTMAVLEPSRFADIQYARAFDRAAWARMDGADAWTLNVFVVSFIDEGVARRMFDESHSYFASRMMLRGARRVPLHGQESVWGVTLRHDVLASRLRHRTIVFVEGRNATDVLALIERCGR